MIAADVLWAAARAGVNVTVDGSDLTLDAATELPAAIVEGLKEHKAEIWVGT